MKEEALKLADEVAKYTVNDGVDDLNKRVVRTIRGLVEELDKQTYKADLLENRLRVITGKSQAEIDQLNLELGNPIDHEEWGKYQVAVEERHSTK